MRDVTALDSRHLLTRETTAMRLFIRLIGAAALPRVREKLSVDGVVVVAILVFASMTFASGRAQTFALLSLVMLVAGVAWIGILACLNVAAQTMCPSYLRARALSIYLLVLQGGMAVGATLWGARPPVMLFHGTSPF